jgi:membrane-associated phospholipid phosphatase
MVYLRYCLLIDLCFLVVYGGCNWLTEQRPAHWTLYFPWELSLPFVPAMIWGYGSMLVLFLLPLFQLEEQSLRRLGRQILLALALASLTFLLLPAQLGFVRSSHVPGYDDVYQLIYAIDYPHNLVPSLHIVFSALIIAALMETSGAAWRGVYALWLAVISASVVLVHQHHIIDVASGYLLAWFCHRMFASPQHFALPGESPLEKGEQ